MKLKVMAMSDLHGNLPEVTEPANIAIIAGDISPLEIQFNKPAMKVWLETEFAGWVKSLPVDKVFLVAGNHDAYFESASRANILAFTQACGKLTYLKNETTHYYDDWGQLWSIFGTPYCHIFGNWPFMRTEEFMTEKFKEIPDKVDIIVTHDPAFGVGDTDVILEGPIHRAQRMFQHLGNEPLRARISDVDYKLLICGHIHGGDHNYNEGWKAVNVSHLNEFYKPVYTPFYIELEHDSAVEPEPEV